MSVTIDGIDLITPRIDDLYLEKSGFATQLSSETLTADRAITFPDSSGTVALTSGLPVGPVLLNTPQTLQNKTFNLSSSPAFASYIGTLATTNFQHTLEIGDIIKFPNIGALSAGIVANTNYTVATTPTTVSFTLTGVTITAGVVNSSTYYVVVQKINQNSAQGGPLKFLCPSTGKAVYFDLSSAATDIVLRFQSAANSPPIQLPTNGGSIPNTANSTTITAPSWTFSNQIISTRAGQITGATSGIYRNPASTALSGANNYHFSYFGTPATTGSTTGFAHTVHIQGQPAGASTASALYIEAGNLLMSPSGNIVVSNLRPTSGSVIGLYPFNDLSTGTAVLYLAPSSVGWAATGSTELRFGDTNHYIRTTNGTGILVNTVDAMTLQGNLGVRVGTNGTLTKLSLNGAQSYAVSLGAGSLIGVTVTFSSTFSSTPRVFVSLNGTSGSFWEDCSVQATDVTTTNFVANIRNNSGSATTGSVNIVYMAMN